MIRKVSNISKRFEIGFKLRTVEHFVGFFTQAVYGRPFFIFFYFLCDINKNWSSYRELHQNSLNTIAFEIGPKLRPTDGARGAWALNGDSKVEGASRESPLNLELLFNVDEHSTSCVRMDVLQYEEGLKSISLFLRA